MTVRQTARERSAASVSCSSSWKFPVLRSIGVQPAQLPTLTELALEDFFITQSPEPWTAEEVTAAFASALAEEDRGQPAVQTT